MAFSKKTVAGDCVHRPQMFFFPSTLLQSRHGVRGSQRVVVAQPALALLLLHSAVRRDTKKGAKQQKDVLAVQCDRFAHRAGAQPSPERFQETYAAK
jgi:hypothetical protein